ncbi:hypothetical protein [Flavobacterium kingsejongi]|uniref:Uncharacterized protein n=1 Tax=Flavobacterium kingsejongi TaxID=1678728 RepID=A0A2S1LRA7_9FLAO|nr:hypothetical protein [Flavobacterium kingsejongi]AWG26264.1 hypothetical protein FK004_14005 [Flavobacterium kingsejongi]
MKFIKAYEFLFYKLFGFFETSMYSRWWSEWKSLTTILVLELWTIHSIKIYYHFFSVKALNNSGDAMSIEIIAFGILLAVIKWYLFEYKDKWKQIVAHFDKLPKSINRKGSIIVALFNYI